MSLNRSFFVLSALVLVCSGCASGPTDNRTARLEDDLSAARQRLAEAPDDLNAHIWVGRRLGYLQRYEEAIQVYSDALLNRPNNARLLRHRGHRYLSTRRYAMAESDLEVAVKGISRQLDSVEPDGIQNSANIPTSTLHTNVFYHLGLARFLQRKWDSAAGAFEQSLSRSTRDDMRVAAANWAALSYFRAGDASAGARVLKSITGARHIIENRNYDDLCLLQLGEIPSSRLLDSLTNGVGLATAGFGLSAFFQRTGEEAKRRAMLHRIVADTPRSAFGHIAAEVDLAHLTGSDLPLGGSIVLAGQRFPIAAPVRVYSDGGYDATREVCWFEPERVLPSRPSMGCNTPSRLGVRGMSDAGRRNRVLAGGWCVADAQAQIDQFVIHYDVCVTSKRCFSVLHDIRGLSVHFLLDVDGTIHQTCDMTARARHAGAANDRSIGIEIAHIGAYSKANNSWRSYYAPRADGRYDLVIPRAFGPPEGGPFTTSRAGEFTGTINGSDLVQVDFTEPQYRSLVALVDALEIALPRIDRDMPRAADGSMLARPLAPEELRAFHGLLGHHHVTRRKTDPGPSFDWQRVLRFKE